MAIRLPRFLRGVPLVEEGTKGPTSAFHQWWEQAMSQIESSFTRIETSLAAAGIALDQISGLTFTPFQFHKRSSTDTSNAAPTLIIPWQTEEQTLGDDITWDAGNNTRITIGTDGTYRVGGFITYTSSTQRAQASVEVLINGVTQGVYRGGSYIRNSGSSWDYWCIELSTEPFNLSENDYIEFQLARNSGAGASYATGGSGTITHRGTSSRIWVERVA